MEEPPRDAAGEAAEDQESGTMLAGDDEIMEMEIPKVMSDEAVKMSVVTFAADGHSRGADHHTLRSQDTNTTIAGRKINRHDVKNVFLDSNTTGIVTPDQIVRIKRMHDKISDGVIWDFNYSCLLTVASVVAGIGLATDSATTVISSMLLSPLMGPVVGMSYGLIVWDLPLIKRSAKTELLSLAYCIIFGLIIGGCCFWTRMAKVWPTAEMENRATRSTFLSGIPIAFFSGLGVALSVLDDQTSSLVGVAISASLLPPAVNSGILWVMAMVKDDDWKDFDFQTLITGEDVDVDKKTNYSAMGIYSLLLTIANIVMVALGATLMFRIKEVLPVKKTVFWEDLKIARRIYKGRALNSESGEALTVEQVGIVPAGHQVVQVS